LNFLVVSVALISTGLAQAQQIPDFLRDFVFPRNGASPADEIHVLYADNCGRPHPDERRAATVTRSGFQVVVDIYLAQPESPFCLAIASPDTLYPVSIGTLAKGLYSVTRRLHVRPADMDEYSLLSESIDSILIDDTPNPAISGTWFNPDASGTGIVLSLVANPDPNTRSDAGLLFIATQTLSGEPEWLSGIASFDSGVLTVPMRRAGTPGSAAADATAVFTYLGCGEATLSATAEDLVFPQGEETLMQLSKTDGLAGCNPPTERPVDLE
jgi:hypothetical protein